MASFANMAISPNPARPGARISFIVDHDLDDMEVSITDLRGRTLRNLYHGPRAAGKVTLSWDGVTHAGTPAASGTYLVRYRTGLKQFMKRMTYIR